MSPMAKCPYKGKTKIYYVLYCKNGDFEQKTFVQELGICRPATMGGYSPPRGAKMGGH